MSKTFIGIDVSKLTLDVCFFKDDKILRTIKVPNNEVGFLKITSHIDLMDKNDYMFCMESCGIYCYSLANFLINNQLQVSMANPWRVKGFMQASMVSNKTDKSDAIMIAKFASTYKLPLWQPRSEQLQEIYDKIKYIEQLSKILYQGSNKLENANLSVKELIENHIKYIKNIISKLEKEIYEKIEKDSKLKNDKELLCTIPGISDKSSSTIIAYIGDIGRFENAKALVSFVGLNPRKYQSGTSVYKRDRISKQGNSSLRSSLFYPAMSSMRCNDIIKDFNIRMKELGKHGKVRICAVMRKLVHIIYGVLKRQEEYNPNLGKQIFK